MSLFAIPRLPPPLRRADHRALRDRSRDPSRSASSPTTWRAGTPGAVLGTALTIKMVLYVVIAPLAAAFVDRLPRRLFLAVLDLVRAGVVLALPFVDEVWHIYVLIALLQSASAAFTPDLPGGHPRHRHRGGPVHAGALGVPGRLHDGEPAQPGARGRGAHLPVLRPAVPRHPRWASPPPPSWFLSTAIPNARPTTTAGPWQRVASGIQTFARTPQLRGVMALNLVVASAGAIVGGQHRQLRARRAGRRPGRRRLDAGRLGRRHPARRRGPAPGPRPGSRTAP